MTAMAVSFPKTVYQLSERENERKGAGVPNDINTKQNLLGTIDSLIF